MKLQKVLSEKKETQRLYTIESGATLRTAAKKMISLKTDYLKEPPESGSFCYILIRYFVDGIINGLLTIRGDIQ